MSTRLMYILAMVASIMAIYLYKTRESALQTTQTQDSFTFKADNIRATQTNENGQVDLQLDAKNLAQDMRSKRLVLEHINATMFSHNQPNNEDEAKLKSTVNLEAKQAVWQQDKELIQIVGDVKGVRQIFNSQSLNTSKTDSMRLTQTPLLNFTTSDLYANTQTKQLWTDAPVRLYAQKYSLDSQGLQVDLNQGKYKLAQLRAIYQPAK